MHFTAPTSLLLFLATSLSLAPSTNALPVPSAFRLSSRIQYFLALPRHHAPPLRIVDDAYAYWEPQDSDIAADGELHPDSIFAPDTEFEAAGDLRKVTQTARKVVETERAALKKAAATKGRRPAFVMRPTLTSSVAARPLATPAFLSSPNAIHIGSASYSPLTSLSTDCPFLIATTPSATSSVTLSSAIFSSTLCGKTVLVSRSGTVERAVVSGRCENCEVWDLDLSEALYHKLAAPEEVRAKSVLGSTEWRFV